MKNKECKHEWDYRGGMMDGDIENFYCRKCLAKAYVEFKQNMYDTYGDDSVKFTVKIVLPEEGGAIKCQEPELKKLIIG